MKFFKGLLNKVNKASIERDGTRELRKSLQDSSLQSGIFRWLLKGTGRRDRAGQDSLLIWRRPNGKKSYILTVTTWESVGRQEKQEPPEWQETKSGVISDLEADKVGKGRNL